MEKLMEAARTAARELIEKAKLQKGDLVVVGCSTSEICGSRIGSDSRPEVAELVFDAIYTTLQEAGIYLAAQCCEHLNRALIVEREAVPHLPRVNVVPQPKAGGSFATAVWEAMTDPVAVESVKAHAGMDIGATLIGMHLRRVAVPVRLSVDKIGEASLVCARTRPAYVGGPRALYQSDEP